MRPSGADELGPAGAAISQRSRSPSLRIQPLLNSRHRRRQQDNRPQETQAAASADIARERTRKGTLAAMKALWRELADPKIKEHHGPVVKTTRLAAIESRKVRLSSSVADQGHAAPALALVFTRVTPGFWGQRPLTYCVADGQVMIEAGRVFAGLQKAASTAPAHAFNYPAPEGG